MTAPLPAPRVAATAKRSCSCARPIAGRECGELHGCGRFELSGKPGIPQFTLRVLFRRRRQRIVHASMSTASGHPEQHASRKRERRMEQPARRCSRSGWMTFRQEDCGLSVHLASHLRVSLARVRALRREVWGHARPVANYATFRRRGRPTLGRSGCQSFGSARVGASYSGVMAA